LRGFLRFWCLRCGFDGRSLFHPPPPCPSPLFKGGRGPFDVCCGVVMDLLPNKARGAGHLWGSGVGGLLGVEGVEEGLHVRGEGAVPLEWLVGCRVVQLQAGGMEGLAFEAA